MTLIDIPNYENIYQINEQGNVFSLKRKAYLKPHLSSGYPTVDLWKNNKGTHSRIHRLLAILFLPNPENKPFINHKEGNKLNNSLSNLEWCTAKENINHALATGLMKLSNSFLNKQTEKIRLCKRKYTIKQVRQLRHLVDSGMLITEAAKQTGIRYPSARRLVREGRYNTYIDA